MERTPNSHIARSPGLYLAVGCPSPHASSAPVKECHDDLSQCCHTLLPLRRFLEEAVSSVLEDQEGVDVRVLVIDDASPDDSADIARKIAARDCRVDVMVHETNKGNIATFNEGLLDWAQGDYCLLMSADDRLTPGALRRARDLLDAHPEVGFVYGHARWFWQDQPVPTPRTRLRGWTVLARSVVARASATSNREQHHLAGGGGSHIAAEARRRIRSTVTPHTADQEMWLRLAANGDVGFLRGVDQAFYRVHGQNMRTTFNELIDLARSGCFSS